MNHTKESLQIMIGQIAGNLIHNARKELQSMSFFDTAGIIVSIVKNGEIYMIAGEPGFNDEISKMVKSFKSDFKIEEHPSIKVQLTDGKPPQWQTDYENKKSSN